MIGRLREVHCHGGKPSFPAPNSKKPKVVKGGLPQDLSADHDAL